MARIFRGDYVEANDLLKELDAFGGRERRCILEKRRQIVRNVGRTALGELNVKIYLNGFGYTNRPLISEIALRSLPEIARSSWIAITCVA
jgi:hypothetical protein